MRMHSQIFFFFFFQSYYCGKSVDTCLVVTFINLDVIKLEPAQYYSDVRYFFHRDKLAIP